MRYGSVCSGIEAATAAWHGLGFQAAWFAEIEKFPSCVLAHHYPDVTNLGDMTKIADMVKSGQVEAPDILVGGTPCQSFSISGLRNSLDDERGQLSLEFVRLANEIDSARLVRGEQPCIIVWENVPGVLSTKDNAFGCFLGALSGSGCELKPSGQKWSNAGCVFGLQRQVAWRILDAQYFGLAQRRKRVFVVASARTECIAEILFERSSVRGNPPQSQSTKQDNTASIAKCLTRRGAGGLNSDACTANFVVHGTQDPIVNTEIAHCLGRNKGQENAVFCINANIINKTENLGGHGLGVKENQAYTLTKTDRHAVCDTAATLTRGFGDRGVDVDQITGGNCAIQSNKVRRLTPLECERLQGFPDQYTNIPGAVDSHRYAALGNSMAVNVMRWIGGRIQSCCEVNHAPL